MPDPEPRKKASEPTHEGKATAATKGEGTPQSEEVSARAEAEVSQVEEQAERLLAQVERDAASGLNVDGGKAAAALRKVLQDANSLRFRFMQRMREIFSIPGQVVKELKETMLIKELYKPDNPKIMQRILKEVKAGTVPIAETVKLYQRAFKRDEWAWRGVEQALAAALLKEIAAEFSKGRSEQAFQLYDSLPEQSKHRANKEIVKQLVQAETAGLPTSQPGDFKSFLARRAAFEQARERILSFTSSRYDLQYIYINDHREQLAGQLFTTSEQFLLKQPVDAIDRLSSFPPPEQTQILAHWTSHAETRWAEVLVDEQAEQLTTVILEFSQVNSFYPKTDRRNVLLISQQFSAAQRSAAWEKAGQPQAATWESVRMYVLMGNNEKATPEQLRKLDQSCAETIALYMEAYGDQALVDMWSEDSVQDLVEMKDRIGRASDWRSFSPEGLVFKLQMLPESVRRHVPLESGGGSGRPSDTRPGRTIWDFEGFQGVSDRMDNFFRGVDSIPEKYRDQVFSVLKPKRFGYHLGNIEYLREPQAERFLEFVSLAGAQGRITLEGLCQHRTRFDSPQWEQLRAGIVAVREQGVPLLLEGDLTLAHFTLYEQAGRPEHQLVNRFIRESAKESGTLVERQNFTHDQYQRSERTPEDVNNWYKLNQMALEFFSTDADLVGEFLSLKPNDVAVIKALVGGTLVEATHGKVDRAVVEGVGKDVGRILRQLDDHAKKCLERFSGLSTEQKVCWKKLYANMLWNGGWQSPTNADRLFQLAISAEGQAAVDFTEHHKIAFLPAQVVLAMAKRPDCIGLFHYVSQQVGLDKQLALIKQLVFLKDAGLPATYYLSEVSHERVFNYEVIEALEKWEPGLLVRLAHHMARVSPGLLLHQLIMISGSGDPEGEQLMRDRISLAGVYAYRYILSGPPPLPEELETAHRRLELVRTLTGLELDSQQRGNLSHIKEGTWERLVAKPEILVAYLHSGNSLIPESILALPDEVLADQLVWQYGLPQELQGNVLAVESLMKVVPILEAYQPTLLTSRSYGREYVLARIIEAYDRAPWLFSERNLKIIDASDERVLWEFSVLKEDRWNQVKEDVARFRFNSPSDVRDFLALYNPDKLLIPPSVVASLRGVMGRIPWGDAQEIALHAADEVELLALVQQKDTTSENWMEERKHFLSEKIREVYPGFLFEKSLEIKHLTQLSKASATTLGNFQFLTETCHALSFNSEYFEQYLRVAVHQNFLIVAQLLKLEGFHTDSLLTRDNPQINRFIDRLTPELAAELKTWPKPLSIQIHDTLDFFAHPIARELLDFARQLQVQFPGETFSAYDLLLFNEQDIAALKQLPNETFFQVTKENLKALVKTVGGEKQSAVQKALSSFDHRYQMDVAIALEDLRTLSPELRLAVLEAKVENFGWSILRSREILLGELGIRQADYDKLICAAYRIQPRAMPFCDLPVAAALLSEHQQMGERDVVDRLKDIIPKFNGEMADLFKIARVSGSVDPLIQEVVRKQFGDFEKQQPKEQPLVLTDSNWQMIVLAYVRNTAEDYNLPTVDKAIRDQAVELFKRADAKEFVSQRLQRLWHEQLNQEHSNELIFDLSVVTNFVRQCRGAGLLSQFEALALFADTYATKVTDPEIKEATRTSITSGLRSMENRFSSERWSNDDKADFYNISRDILQADHGLLAKFMDTFNQLSPKELKRFADEVYPLYRAQLAVTGVGGHSEGVPRTYFPEDLAQVEETIREFAQAGKGDKTRFERLKKILVADIGRRFKQRFGITRIPEEFTPDHVRSISNLTLYLANMASRTPEKERVLGLYLGLLINNQWEAFRRGEPIDAREYLVDEGAEEIAALLKKRTELDQLTSERLNIPASDWAEFQQLLQREVPAIAVGAVETIDVKLGNVITNLRRLEDPDLYPDHMDQQRMGLLLEFGNKRVGAVAAKFYVEQNPIGPQVAYSAEESEVKERMIRILQEAGIPQTADAIKGVFQEAMKPLAILANVVKFIEEVKAEDDIEHLRGLLHPTDEVVTVFNRLGEEFKPTSGALALSQDLDYLDNIIVKREEELTPEEARVLKEYVAGIRAQVVKLQATYDQIKVKFSTVRGSMGNVKSELLRVKLGEIETIINAEAAQLAVTSNMTHNLNSIIENIRECLSCVRQGCNNDTDLTFGDSNKFFIYSHTAEQRKGSIADQIVFLEPVSVGGQPPEMSFVFDRVYGNCTPFILNNHIAAVFKKYKTIKQRFPEAKLSLLVTDAAIQTAGTTPEMLRDSLKNKFGPGTNIERVESEIDVVASATGDHYVEFGGGTRVSGKRTVNGLRISL